jgi:hypothetical protein
MFETMASCHVGRACQRRHVRPPADARDLPADSCAESQAVPDQHPTLADTADVLDELGLGAGRRSRLGLERILLPHAELPRGSIFRLPPRRVLPLMRSART